MRFIDILQGKTQMRCLAKVNEQKQIFERKSPRYETEPSGMQKVSPERGLIWIMGDDAARCASRAKLQQAPRFN